MENQRCYRQSIADKAIDGIQQCACLSALTPCCLKSSLMIVMMQELRNKVMFIWHMINERWYPRRVEKGFQSFIFGGRSSVHPLSTSNEDGIWNLCGHHNLSSPHDWHAAKPTISWWTWQRTGKSNEICLDFSASAIVRIYQEEEEKTAVAEQRLSQRLQVL